MLGSINNRGKVSEPCLSSPIITLHRGTLSIPPPPPKGERPNGSFTQWSVTVHQSQVIIVVSLLLLSFGQLKSFFRTYVLANVTRSPLNTIRGLINQRLSAGPRLWFQLLQVLQVLYKRLCLFCIWYILGIFFYWRWLNHFWVSCRS